MTDSNADEMRDREELKDRLVDQAMREVLSGESPPDLSDSILSAAGTELVATKPHKKIGAACRIAQYTGEAAKQLIALSVPQ